MVVLTFEPSEELGVIDIVSGEEIAGSNQWLKVGTEGGNVFVHDSLATESSAAPVLAPTLMPTAVNSAGLANRSDWVVFNGPGFTIQTPPHWDNGVEVFSDEDLVQQLAQLYAPDDPQAYIDFMHQIVADGYYDTFLIDLSNGMVLHVWHEDRGGVALTPDLLRRIMIGNARKVGSEVLSNEVTGLPAGDAVHLHVRDKASSGSNQPDTDTVVYGLVTPTQIFYIEVIMDTSDFDVGSSIANSVAFSFQFGTAVPIVGDRT